MSTDAKSIVTAFYDAILAGQVEEAIRDRMTSDVVWDNPLPEPIPFGGRFEGHDGVADYLEKIFGDIEIEEFEIKDVLAEGDHIVLIGQETCLVKSTGKRYTMDWVHQVKLRDGRIAYIREYNDTACIHAAYV